MGHRPLVVGLTGGIGAGKSTVAALLAGRGALIVDCDGLGRKVVEPDGSAYAAVVDRFGPGIVGEDGRIDRGTLAALVFADPEALADLNAITHPAIDLEIHRAIEAADRSPVVLDMAVLVETGLGRGQYDLVVVVEAPLAIRIERLVSARGMSVTDVESRMASQAGDGERRAVADHVIVNDGDTETLAAAVERLWPRLASHRS